MNRDQYVDDDGGDAIDVRAIAFYLPQYHPVPENDAWWGKGFTEWSNVARARPLFAGHHQPQLPADLGFYDLRLPEVREQQAALARGCGLHGFCYYHYWFNGRRILEKPLEAVLQSGQPEFPFCVCWANEAWTTRWDGGTRDVVLDQQYSAEDDIAFIRHLIPYFRDRRYIRVHDKPLLLVYIPTYLPEPAATAARWRRECAAAGLPGLYLCAGRTRMGVDPAAMGFDAAFDFPPNCQPAGFRIIDPASLPGLVPGFRGRIADYRSVATRYLGDHGPGFRLHKAVMTPWDNTARHRENATLFLNAHPEYYETWLCETVEWTNATNPPGERLVFINAWNEWAEGAHLEPDQRHGHRYLEATRRALGGPA